MCKVQPFSGYSFIIYHLHMPLYFAGTFTGYPCYKKLQAASDSSRFTRSLHPYPDLFLVLLLAPDFYQIRYDQAQAASYQNASTEDDPG